MPAPDHAARALRVPLGGVDDARARELLSKYRSLTKFLVARAYRQIGDVFFFTTRDEMQAVADAAVLEASTTYRVGDRSREKTTDGGMRAWVRLIVSSRLSDYASSLRKELGARTFSQRADAHNGVLRGKPTEEASPATAVYSRQVYDWMLDALGRLEPRERVIVTAVVFEGQTFESIGSSLGLSRPMAWRVYRKALDRLRVWAADEGIDSASLAMEAV